MFELSMGEIILVLVVSLIILGPERLPKVAYFIGAMIGKVQRFVSSVKTEINTQVRQSEFTEVGKSLQESFTSINQELDNTVKEVEQDLQIMQSNLSSSEWKQSSIQPSLEQYQSIPVNHKSLTSQARQKKYKRPVVKNIKPKLRARNQRGYL